MDGAVSIINLFCRDLARELTIRQISKLIKKSYAYSNKEVWELIDKEVLNKKEIGKSVICSINLKNEMARTLLALNSTLEKQDHFKEKDMAEMIKPLKENNALTAFFSKNKLFVVCINKSSLKNIKANLLTKEEFVSSIKEIGFDNLLIYGYEKYWEIIGDKYE